MSFLSINAFNPCSNQMRELPLLSYPTDRETEAQRDTAQRWDSNPEPKLMNSMCLSLGPAQKAQVDSLPLLPAVPSKDEGREGEGGSKGRTNTGARLGWPWVRNGSSQPSNRRKPETWSPAAGFPVCSPVNPMLTRTTSVQRILLLRGRPVPGLFQILQWCYVCSSSRGSPWFYRQQCPHTEDQ